MTLYRNAALMSILLVVLTISNAQPNPSEKVCLNQCAQNYTYPTQPPQACCGCCDASAGDYCAGNKVELSTCCKANQDFCGCISARAFCLGSIYNNTYPVESTFGTCFPKGFGGCFYEPNPNVWIVCPTGTTGCISGNTISSCCTSDKTCNSLTGQCEATVPPTSPPHDCGCIISTDQCCHDHQTGHRCFNPSLYSCTTNEKGQRVLCSAGSNSCGDACYSESHYCCRNGNLQPAGSCSSTPTSANPTTTTSQQPSNTGTTTPPSTGPNNCGCVIPTDRCCHDLRTGNRCYNPGEYSCTINDQNQNVLCLTGYNSCGDACYSPSQYCCQNGLKPAGSCGSASSIPTSAHPTTSASNSGTGAPTSTNPDDCGCIIPSDECCHDLSTGKRCFNPNLYACTSNDQGQSVLCSAGSNSCGNACYSTSQYCCKNGGLQPAGSC